MVVLLFLSFEDPLCCLQLYCETITQEIILYCAHAPGASFQWVLILPINEIKINKKGLKL